MRTGFIVGLALAIGCGGGNNTAGDAPIIDAHHLDSPHGSDAGHDSGPGPDTVLPDGHPDSVLPDGMVIHDGGSGSDGGIVIADASSDTAFPNTCDVLAQTGCNAGEKCTWIVDGSGNGHIGCGMDGSVAVGGTCAFTGTTAVYDNCAAGNYCISSTCEPICALDPTGQPQCDANHACQRYSELFTDSTGNQVGGMCDTRCDPLTQVSYPSLAACNSPMPAAPVHTCVSGNFTDWTCAPSGSADYALTDRVAITGTPYLNACAPGFMPILYSDSTTFSTICTGLCAPLDIDNTHTANAAGDATIAAKLPTDPAPVAGHGTCAVGKKGSEALEECRFIWPLNFDPSGNLRASPYNNTLGYCFAPEHYMYDSDGDGSLDTTDPYCTSLSMADAITFGCYTSGESGYPAHHAAPSALTHGMRLPYGPAPLARHTFR